MDTAVRTGVSWRGDQLYLWVWGAILVVLGAGSLLLHPDFAVGDAVTDEHLFGVFEVNGWHGVAGLTSGLVALAFARSDRWAPTVAALVGGVGGVLPAIAMFLAGDGNVALGLIPVDYVDAVLLHLVPGLLGLAVAMRYAVCGISASGGMTPKRPDWKSSTAWISSARVFITKGP